MVNEPVIGLITIKHNNPYKAYNVIVKVKVPKNFAPIDYTNFKPFSLDDFDIIISKGHFDYNRDMEC